MTDTNIKKRANSSTKTLVLTAMFTAMITVTTMFIKVSTPLGYIHAGDALVYLGAAVLPFPYGFVAASLGGALADLLSGYAHFCLPTAIIKSMMVLALVLVRLALKHRGGDDKIIKLPVLLALIPGALATVFGYFAANILLYDVGAAAAELVTDSIQAVAGAGIFVILAAPMDKTGLSGRIKGSLRLK